MFKYNTATYLINPINNGTDIVVQTEESQFINNTVDALIKLAYIVITFQNQVFEMKICELMDRHQVRLI